MPFSGSHVQYVLAQFDSGVPPHQILMNLQYRDFLPSLNIGTIERCLRDNGRILNNQRAGNTTQGNTLHGTGYASNQLPQANQGATDASRATQGSSQFPTGAVRETSTNANHHVADSGSGPTMRWDAQADAITLEASMAGMSGDEICRMLRSRGYDINRTQVGMSLLLNR